MYGFLSVQIMFGSQKLSHDNTPEPFNGVLEGFFDPGQRFKKILSKISLILWSFSKFFKDFFFFTNNQLDGFVRLKNTEKNSGQSHFRAKKSKFGFF